jgi:beta-glucosidase
MKKKSAILRGCAAIMAFLLLLSVTATNLTFQYDTIINRMLGISTVADNGSDGPIYWPNDYGYNDTALVDVNRDAAAANVEIQEEGTVLLKNANSALPLSKDSQMTVFGYASVNSSIFNTSTASYMNYVSFLGALENEFGADNINETLCTDVYPNVESGSRGGNPMQGATDTNITEAPIDSVTKYANTWQSDHNDAAIVVFGRSGGEGNDLFQYSTTETYTDGSPRRILDLSVNEEDLIKYVTDQKNAGVFDNVIVVIASEFPMELGFLDEYGVDSALMVGTCGTFGCTAIAEILGGDVNPSGRVVDTYAANSVSAPATVYAGQEGTQTWTNADEVNAANPLVNGGGGTSIDYYNIYAEGIYVGYKYYETRYEDAVTGLGNADSTEGSSTNAAWNYADEMDYTFGYGLSYTDFEQKLDSIEYDTANDAYTVTVTVKNTGSAAGKDVVEVYAQTPYGDYEKENLVEKASVNLVAYDKTDELEPDQSQTLTLSVPGYFLASYDTYGVKTYILSAGDYYLAIGSDAHDALDNILAAKGYTTSNGMTADGNESKTYTWNQADLDTTTYSTSPYTGVEVTNQFDDADIRSYGYDFTYLTRSDWQGTYPTEAVKLAATDQVINSLSNYYYTTPADAPAVSDFTQGADNGLKLIDMYGVDFNDDTTWNKFLDEFTVEQLANLMTDNLTAQQVPELGVPGESRTDDDTNPGGQFRWLSHPTTARTWNNDMFALRGKYEGLIAGLNNIDEVWYGAANLHRTPYGGRTNQYWAEDATIDYYAGYYEAQAMQSTGVICCVKHFTTNDQETDRTGLSTFLTEQPLREIYLRAFEGSFEGGALGTMCALNRLGTKLAKNSYPLLTTVLRGEWGFEGHVTSDGYVPLGYFQNTLEELTAGMDYSCIDTTGFNADVIKKAIEKDNDGYILQSMRLAAKRDLYAMLQTTRINGLGTDTVIMTVVPGWEKALLAVNLVIFIGFVVLVLLSVVTFLKRKNSTVAKKEKERGVKI